MTEKKVKKTPQTIVASGFKLVEQLDEVYSSVRIRAEAQYKKIGTAQKSYESLCESQSELETQISALEDALGEIDSILTNISEVEEA